MSKFEIDFELLEKIIAEDKTPFAQKNQNNSYALQQKASAIQREYIKQAGLEKEPYDKSRFEQVWQGFVLASGIIGYHFALHSLKSLQSKCGEIKCYDPVDSRLAGAPRNTEELSETMLIADNIACFLVAYQHDCFEFHDKKPYVKAGHGTIRTSAVALIEGQKVKDQEMFLEDRFNVEGREEPMRGRRPSLGARS